LLRSDILLSSTVTSAIRDGSKGHKLLVKTPTGFKLIKAKKLLLTIPPTLSDLYPFYLDDIEKAVFKEWQWHNCYVGVVEVTGIDPGTTLINASPNTKFDLPIAPFVWHFDPTGVPNVFTVEITGNETLTEAAAKDLVFSAIQTFKTAGTFAMGNPIIRAFGNHSPLTMFPTSKAIQNGFYKSLYALQGHKGTYYTGNAFAADYSSLVWLYNEQILPLIVG
jgi:beta-cyclopiazonate dehydrogenase